MPKYMLLFIDCGKHYTIKSCIIPWYAQCMHNSNMYNSNDVIETVET